MPVVALCPDVVTALRLNQLRCDANTIARLAEAAFEDIAHAEFATDLSDLDCATLVGEA